MTWPCPGGSREGRILGPGVAALLLLLLAVSCDTAPSSYSYAVPPAITSTHLRPTVEAMEVERYAQAIQAERAKDAAEATLAVFWAQETVRVREQNATATAQAQATAAAATASAQAAILTQQAADRTATATAHIWQQTATATAHAPTATAEKVLFDLSVQQTTEAWSITRQAQESALHAQETAQAAMAEQARLEAERARLTYPVRAYGPWALLLAAFVLLVWAGYRMTRAAEARVRAVPRDARGDAPILVLPLQGGGETVIDPDRSFGPVLEVRNGVAQPQLTPPEYQAQVTGRDQAVDLVSRGLPGQGQPGKRRLPPSLSSTPPLRPLIRIVPPEQVRPWLEEVEPKVLGHIEEEQ
ncbi:MAG: hypothetical protein N2556_04215 [Anaerolineae bacterium]|nr:hypothetical protein [Anaerolineae bacterium]